MCGCVLALERQMGCREADRIKDISGTQGKYQYHCLLVQQNHYLPCNEVLDTVLLSTFWHRLCQRFIEHLPGPRQCEYVRIK